MAKKDERIDAYIGKAAPFAQPILKHLRKLVHQACPNVEETVKWGMPCFDYKGPFCSMASFKEHCSFSFWKTDLMKHADFLKKKQEEGMGNLGKIKSKTDLPSDKQMIEFLLDAVQINEEGLKLPSRKQAPAPEPEMPDDFKKLLAKTPAAKKHFETFAPSHRKEYINWITGAKQEKTRNSRMTTAIEWISEGKGMHWKYEKKN